MRSLTNDEMQVVQRIARKIGDKEDKQLLSDMVNAQAEDLAADGSRIGFDIHGYECPSYRGQHPYSVKGKVLDQDGVELSVLLYADENGRLLELEIVRWSLRA